MMYIIISVSILVGYIIGYSVRRKTEYVEPKTNSGKKSPYSIDIEYITLGELKTPVKRYVIYKDGKKLFNANYGKNYVLYAAYNEITKVINELEQAGGYMKTEW